ncbi:uncharacterized protein LOC110682644 [Chenopodium quinoa]|uniref:uncharacterized protein LOC110682644 n=1 Tax=Chenopodium quinoa TaxID=63459 RepID=UPI000B776AC7|nr:uncharacterized protein LOC110682644 [Chenopodium quinoa]
MSKAQSLVWENVPVWLCVSRCSSSPILFVFSSVLSPLYSFLPAHWLIILLSPPAPATSSLQWRKAVASLASWVFPPDGSVKVNTDAHVVDGVLVGLGVVIRDSEGCLLVCATRRCPATTPEVAEAMAVRYGLQVARRLGYSKVVVECDAISVVQSVRRRISGYSPLFLVYDDIYIDSLFLISFVFSILRGLVIPLHTWLPGGIWVAILNLFVLVRFPRVLRLWRNFI